MRSTCNPHYDFLGTHPFIVGICGTDPSDPMFRLDGAPGVTPEQMAQAHSDAAAFDWTVRPDPNPAQFLTDCASDTAVPGDFGTIGFLNLLSGLSGDALKAQWLKSKGALSADAQTAIETHAANNFIMELE